MQLKGNIDILPAVSLQQDGKYKHPNAKVFFQILPAT